MVLTALAAPALLVLRARPALLAGALAVVFLVPTGVARSLGDDHIARERTFFGVYRVVESGGLRAFHHGTTLHGAERHRPDGTVDSRITYYGPRTPYAEVAASLARRPDPLVLGIAGLGTGSLACFARPGDEVRIYEIDPAVVRLAREHFAALRTCAPDAAIAVGDARLLIAREQAAFDFLALDAFTSDAIPIHLLTLEAFRSYLRVLAPEGILAVHVSNRHLDLEPVVAAIAARTGLAGRIKRYSAPKELAESKAATSSHLVVLARDDGTLEALDLDAGWVPLGAPDRVRVWTDDYASIVPSFAGGDHAGASDAWAMKGPRQYARVRNHVRAPTARLVGRGARAAPHDRKVRKTSLGRWNMAASVRDGRGRCLSTPMVALRATPATILLPAPAPEWPWYDSDLPAPCPRQSTPFGNVNLLMMADRWPLRISSPSPWHLIGYDSGRPLTSG